MTRLITKALLLAAAATCVVARSPAPRFSYDPNTSPYCMWWVNYEGTQSCDDILYINWITIEEFRRWNPSIGAACAGIQTERSYCVDAFGEPEPTPTTSSTEEPPTTTTPPPGNGITTPQPTQPGMVDDCNRFYFVQTDDTCADIASAHDISLAQFITWNPTVGGVATCEGLWANVHVCVGVIETTPTTTTTPDNGIATPQPTQPGMVSNCDRFYFVEVDDICDDIVSQLGITLAQLITWNDVGGSDCRDLWANVWICVRIIS